jgi:hypothetical protein
MEEMKEMLNEHEIYVLGKAAVDEIRDDYYRRVAGDTITVHPEQFFSYLDAAIAKLERVKKFEIDYLKSLEE